MAGHSVIFDTAESPVEVPTGTLLTEAAQLANVALGQPCGGQGRCGRCAIIVRAGSVRRRSTLRLSAEDIAAGYALACQAVVEGDVQISIPPQEKIERRLTTDRIAAEVHVPAGYDPARHQSVARVALTLSPPSMDDQTDDWSRLQTALRQQAGIDNLTASLPALGAISNSLRAGQWQVSAVIDLDPPVPRLIGLFPMHAPSDTPLWGIAIDIGTTTVSLWLANLISGEVRSQVAEYNGQITRGEDVISRIIYASKNQGAAEMQGLILETINSLVEVACQRARITPDMIVKATVVGNSTMIHLLLGLPAESIRLAPFVTTVNQVPHLTASATGIGIHPEATVECLPGVASYVGADITAGVLSSGLDDTEDITLFIDIGTNGEIVLGNREWLLTCACSAGPAFEGAGVRDGMRATQGAIEEIWINGDTWEPTIRVIGGGKPRGLCGSGLIALLAEMFLTGVIDKGGHLNIGLPTPRIRTRDHTLEYVVAWADETANGRDITITSVDIDNLLRAKAAIYAGFGVLAESAGLALDAVARVLVGGAFGKYINVEKAVEIGLLPDMPWECFEFLGNTAIKGAYLALLDRFARDRIRAIANRLTYIELSADNRFYEAFTSALFLPHTDLSRFPTVQAALTP